MLLSCRWISWKQYEPERIHRQPLWLLKVRNLMFKWTKCGWREKETGEVHSSTVWIVTGSMLRICREQLCRCWKVELYPMEIVILLSYFWLDWVDMKSPWWVSGSCTVYISDSHCVMMGTTQLFFCPLKQRSPTFLGPPTVSSGSEWLEGKGRLCMYNLIPYMHK